MSSTYLISYDLASNDKDKYEQVIDYIKTHKSWAHIHESFWAVATDKTASIIRDDIDKILKDSDSRIIVIKSGIESAWINPICSSKWLKNNL